MPISFIPSSPFGTYGLRQLLESRGTYIAVQLLNVPEAAPGDRTTWTWTTNWSQYAVAGAFSGTGGNLNISSQGASPPASIATYDPATSAWPGAYYDTDYLTNGRVYMYNGSVNTYTYTHVAVFVMQQNAATLASLQFTDQSLLKVGYVPNYATTPSLPATATLAPYNAKLFGFALPDSGGGASLTIAEGWDSWINYYEYWDVNYATLSAPYPVLSTNGYNGNKETSPPFLPSYKALLGITDQDNTTSFLAELLNVTSTEPDFGDGWYSWSTYRINRYSTAAIVPTGYNYTAREYANEYVFSGVTYEDYMAGTEISYKNYTEFIFTPPAAGSFTFTHIAVFVNEAEVPPQQGSTYTYADTTKLVGVIKLPASVTMTTSSAARAYPFRFSYLGPMDLVITELGS